MRNFIMLLLMLLSCSIFGVSEANAEQQRRYVPGCGTYGVSTKRYQCSRCGKMVMAGSGHSCVYDDGRPSRSSSGGSGGYDVSDSEADGVLATTPGLLINESYVRVPSAEESYEVEETESNDDEDEGIDWGVVFGFCCLVGLVIAFLKD